jgi:hypothetical protein
MRMQHGRPRRWMALVIGLALIFAGGGARPTAAVRSSAEASGNHAITNVTLNPRPSNLLALGQNVSLTFDYTTDEASGVRIFARPFSNGALTPGYAAHGSPLYATGSGTGTGSFTIITNPATVDQIRFQMYNADQSELLFEAFIPVYYQFVAVTNAITSIALTPATPNLLAFNQDVNLTFNYSTDVAGGVRIFARPFTNGALTPGYAAHGSPLYATGSGSGNGFFTITSGAVTVDQIRFQMYNADQSQLIFEAFIPVHYQFRAATNAVTNVTLNPATPNLLALGQNVNLTFDYTTSVAGGVRIFARPFTNGALSPSYAAHPSPLYATGSGSGTGSFTITSGAVTVDQIRFQMYNADQSLLVFETLIPVHYQFGTSPLLREIYLPLVMK